jgi:hypothetical protein
MEMDTFENRNLATAALLVFSIAVISQWALGVYAADYYDDSALPKNLSGHHKGFTEVDFRCDKRN